mmetsp:Transcript_32374/g.84922  ORF Transcript_32374/g.84922 Transcript_32374/m.84922 type:complete len:356 (-) Transcript_32374:533-1600(-)
MANIDKQHYLGVVLSITLKAIAVPLSLGLLRVYVDPKYSSPHCLLRLVNETAPQHWQNHPVWKHLTYDESCAGYDALSHYVQKQYTDQAEHRLFTMFICCEALVAAALFLFLLCRHQALPCFRSFVTVAATFFVADQINKLELLWTHFEQDVTFMLGNILHHTDISAFTTKSNTSFVSALPQGFLLSIFLCQTWKYGVCCFLVIRADERLRSVLHPGMLAMQLAITQTIIFYQLKHNHPLYHEIAKLEHKNAWPYTFEYRAYKHVYVHHHNGDSFGSSFHWDPFFSAALHLFGYLHNSVLGLTIDTALHYAFATAFDIGMGLMVTTLVWVMLRAAVSFVDSLAGNARSGVKDKPL